MCCCIFWFKNELMTQRKGQPPAETKRFNQLREKTHHRQDGRVRGADGKKKPDKTEKRKNLPFMGINLQHVEGIWLLR